MWCPGAGYHRLVILMILGPDRPIESHGDFLKRSHRVMPREHPEGHAVATPPAQRGQSLLIGILRPYPLALPADRLFFQDLCQVALVVIVKARAASFQFLSPSGAASPGGLPSLCQLYRPPQRQCRDERRSLQDILGGFHLIPAFGSNDELAHRITLRARDGDGDSALGEQHRSHAPGGLDAPLHPCWGSGYRPGSRGCCDRRH
jgi:hypothetical protein